jgi:large subunit ribosomal protein L22
MKALAKAALTYLSKKSSPALVKLLDSAVANARGQGISAESLYVKEVMVNKGAVLKRYRPFARGRAGTLRKTMSIVHLELGTKSSGKAPKTKKPKNRPV